MSIPFFSLSPCVHTLILPLSKLLLCGLLGHHTASLSRLSAWITVAWREVNIQWSCLHSIMRYQNFVTAKSILDFLKWLWFPFFLSKMSILLHHCSERLSMVRVGRLISFAPRNFALNCTFCRKTFTSLQFTGAGHFLITLHLSWSGDYCLWSIYSQTIWLQVDPNDTLLVLMWYHFLLVLSVYLPR